MGNKLHYGSEEIDYIVMLANSKFDNPVPYSNDWCIVFPHRYNESRSPNKDKTDNDIYNFPKTYKEYINDIELPKRIKALGLDLEKFWCFMLFLYDVSFFKSKNTQKKKDHPVEEFRNIIKDFDNIVESNNTIEREVKLELKINNRKVTSTTSKNVINWIRLSMLNTCKKFDDWEDINKKKNELYDNIDIIDNLIKETEEGSIEYLSKDLLRRSCYDEIKKLDEQCGCKFLMDNFITDDYLSNEYEEVPESYRNYIFIKYLMDFMKVFNSDKTKQRSKDKLFNKKSFAVELLLFCGLIDGDKDEDYIKNVVKYYEINNYKYKEGLFNMYQ